ncbi:hypothetical protein A3A76_05590 [Candidatus Woesebacteria bacterium RIFCSPLOWO2_01_FULL_39_23]|uniref:Uncharacterized protein n=1 Tax=Candidatus Woesebacteria bacterium RIFCSPHIGHO2_01_FULL_40_22 TaxID=1802499 RepID=A0A1F7YKX5_9BACT|nr:MAG: hypothetical protein A2141_03720 [Candidatus Woesebacteria bacterium RBG_16_40_11]OGM27927.1 MAG: hypothetical protein A2628_03515 [Candidatus Woesebacteria bacterium RIFCSPHIGHO2_01_FULL_40_22]OGM37531.1 MAG: hypothetical protein A3E41_01740 [Candidatus Woesebacteria bacterium RIFCSPHIGHO2_12_FULL_38_9]OGM61683.1 MAG: hypothetical protein A3A76_05590 [Candidatus Woesebacteria bacterium RIFCSPLOWO2_01_FULL_39_23]
MPTKIIDFFSHVDALLSSKISDYLKPYYDKTPPGFFSGNINLFIKIIIYTILLVIPIALLKLFLPFSKISAIILTILITIIGILAFATLLGFIQLLYSFTF